MDEQVNPTRMELINVKERMLLADKGHQLLKQKRDVLVIELMTILHTSITVRDRLNGEMRRAYSSLAAAESYHSIFELENIAQPNGDLLNRVAGMSLLAQKTPTAYSSKPSKGPSAGQ